LTDFPSSVAEFGGIGSANSPWTANLGLCARMAHQIGRVGNAAKFRHPQGKRYGAAFFGYFLGLQPKSDSPVGRDPQCQSKIQKEIYETPIPLAGNSKPTKYKQTKESRNKFLLLR